MAESLPAAAPPATDFFAAQDAARRRARWWFMVFAACVAAHLAVVVGYVMLIAGWLMLASRPYDLLYLQALAAVPAGVILGAVAVTLVIVSVGWTARVRSLQQGSDTVAQSIGARAVPADALPPTERQLRNVAEEMALASGGLPPALYVLEGEGTINALSGVSAGEPFLIFTRGALERLQRDELQALVAYGIGQHRNGDALLNVRMVGWLAGLTRITEMGRSIFRTPARIWRGAADGGGTMGDGSKALMFLSIPLVALGGVLMVIGHVGVVLARFVRALASRQRVHLADATAVQYTRDPVAVRDLLRRVETEAEASGGRLSGPYAEEFGPLLFVPGVRRLCLRTHPRMHQRLARLERRAG